MKTPMYLYSVKRKLLDPSEMASWMSAAFWTTCWEEQKQQFEITVLVASCPGRHPPPTAPPHLIITTLLLFQKVLPAVGGAEHVLACTRQDQATSTT